MPTVTKLREYKTYLYNEAGKPVAMQLNLKDKAFRLYIEDMLEDYEDTMIAMERDNDDTISMEEVEKRVLALQNQQ